MTGGDALAQMPTLTLIDATPDEDEAALTQLALWCTRYSPLVAPDPPAGVFIDIAGSAHLFKGEAGLIDDLAARLRAAQLLAKIAVADTPGCAWAMARFCPDTFVAPGPMSAPWCPLPVAAVRLPSHTVES